MTTELAIGLVGVGRIGAMHARNICRHVENARLHAVADISLAASQKVCASLQIPHAHQDYRVLIDDDSIDAIVICSATPTHAQIITDAAEAGKHIFCEKPIDLELPVIDRALAAVERSGVKLQVGFNRRFDPTYARVRAAIANDEIGTPHLMHLISRDPAPPSLDYLRASGGIFLDMTIHDFDMARFLFGCEVVEVFAASAVLIDPDIGDLGDFDTALITLRFENGALAVIDNSRQSVTGYDQRVEVHGNAGSISTQNRYPNNVAIMNAAAVRRDPPYYFFTERYAESYVLEMQAFVNAILQDSPVPVTGHDGRMPVVLGMAAMQSVQDNRPVPIDCTAQ